MIGFKRGDISDELILLEESNVDYITKSGDVYKYSSDTGLYYKRTKTINKHNGYAYVSIRFKKDNKNKNRRLHILLAKTFLKNPNNYKIVGHKNNNKADNRLENLYWTTNQENTQKAFDDKLNIQKKGIDDDNSFAVEVIENSNVIAVYGSMRECDRCIENLTVGYLSKIIKKDGKYKPRGKKYIYKRITKEEYESYPNTLKNLHLTEKTIPKQQTIFKATNIYTDEVFVSDNQKAFGREHELNQAMISHAILNNDIYGDFKFELIDRVEYLNSSAYQNFLRTVHEISIKNIITGDIKSYKTIKEMKEELGLKGNDIRQYMYRDNILMNEWKIIIQ